MPRISSQLHVQVNNPIDKRREILESAVTSTELLQRYQDFKKIRQEKNKQRAIFKKLIKEINMLMKELEIQELPSTGKKPKQIKQIKEKTITVIQPKSTDKLTRDLQEIQDKLNNLKI